MDIYREEILDHYKNPRNFGEIKQASGQAIDRNASCGDVISMSLRVVKDKIKEVKFKGEGCAVSMASASMLTEMVKGKKVSQVKKIKDEEIIKRLGINISSGRKKCATLGLVALKKALENYED